MHRIVKFALVVTVASVIAGSALADAVPFALTGENTKVTFVGSKPAGKHTGGFKKLTGKFNWDGDKSTINVEIDTTSIFSDDAKLTNHLKTPDFFDVKSMPTAKFVSTSVTVKGDEATIKGDLTLHGKTNPVTFKGKLKATADSLSLTSDEFTINRFDYGMTYGKGQIDADVKLKVELTAKK